jgi:hypothetical protein
VAFSSRQRLVSCLAVTALALALGLLGCGGSTSTSHSASTTSAPPTNATVVWASQTEGLCREKRAAIAGLGYVHITYAGIAQVGLPEVKRRLDLYLGRLLGVLREFTGRQRQLVTPPSLSATMAQANEVDLQSQAATIRLRRDVAGARSAAELSSAFQAWITSTRRLAVRGDALPRQLNLAGCLSGATPASS